MHGPLCLDRGAKELIFSLWEAIPPKAMIRWSLNFPLSSKNEVTVLYPDRAIRLSPATRRFTQTFTHFIPFCDTRFPFDCPIRKNFELRELRKNQMTSLPRS
jgi:hypothetical protein